jgi:hypothetical protein
MSLLFYDAVVKAFAGLFISSPQPFWWLSIDWTNILMPITSSDGEENQYEREA